MSLLDNGPMVALTLRDIITALLADEPPENAAAALGMAWGRVLRQLPEDRRNELRLFFARCVDERRFADVIAPYR